MSGYCRSDPHRYDDRDANITDDHVCQEEANGLRGRIAELEGFLAGAHKAENDAKWRFGKCLWSDFNCENYRIGELEEQLRNGASNSEAAVLREEKAALEARVAQLQKESNDQKWR